SASARSSRHDGRAPVFDCHAARSNELKLAPSRTSAPRLARRLGKLLNPYRAFRKLRGDFQLATQRPDQTAQRRNLHVGLMLELRQARLLDAERGRHLTLALTGLLAKLA